MTDQRHDFIHKTSFLANIRARSTPSEKKSGPVLACASIGAISIVSPLLRSGSLHRGRSTLIGADKSTCLWFNSHGHACRDSETGTHLSASIPSMSSIAGKSATMEGATKNTVPSLSCLLAFNSAKREFMLTVCNPSAS